MPLVGNWRETIYVRAEGRLVALIHNTQGSGESIRYAHTDLLGSVHVLTDSSGAVVERLAYDAWGKRRNGAPGTWTDDPAETITSESDRGYTAHEHLGTGLVHMNGRVYDPLIARFLSPDPYLQNPLNTQDFARFSYVNNNPFAYTDPSGFLKIGKIFKSIGKAFKFTAVGILFSSPVKKLIRNTPILQTMMRAAAAATALFPPTAPFAPAIIAATNAYLTHVNGGSFGDVLKSAVISYATSAALQGIGAEAGAIAKTAGPAAGFGVQLAGSAAIGCASAAVQGGSCGSAVISAGFAAFTGGIIQGTGLAGTPGGVFAEALAGGAGSVIGGGKFMDGFVNGFVTAAARYAAAEHAQQIRTNGRIQLASAAESDVPYLAGAAAGAGTALPGEILTGIFYGAGRLLGGIFGVLLTALAGDTAQAPYYYHFTTQAGYEGITQSGVINPSADGYVYMTPIDYQSAELAQEKLALSRKPVGYFSVPRKNVEPHLPPKPVEPWAGQPGGGIEIKAPHPVPIQGGHWTPIR